MTAEPRDEVVVTLPAVLADLTDGQRRISVSPAPATVGDLLEEVARRHVVLGRRLRDETGAVRRFVNIYVDGDDIRHRDGLGTALAPAAEVTVLPSVAGG